MFMLLASIKGDRLINFKVPQPFSRSIDFDLVICAPFKYTVTSEIFVAISVSLID
jgi:hypothetical protein